MKHASEHTITKLEPLLAKVRILPGLVEKKAGVYYLKSRAFLHFHEDGKDLYADIRLKSQADFERFRCNTQGEQATLLGRIQCATTSDQQGSG